MSGSPFFGSSLARQRTELAAVQLRANRTQPLEVLTCDAVSIKLANAYIGVNRTWPRMKSVIHFGYATRFQQRSTRGAAQVGTTMIPPRFLCLLLAGFAWQAAHAAPIYKWRDRAGRVTYSSLPPPAGLKTETIQNVSPPDAEAIRQAEARAKEAQEQAREMEAARRMKEAEEAENARRRALRPPAPIVIEKPVYVPQPIYYPPVRHPPQRHPRDKPPRHPPR